MAYIWLPITVSCRTAAIPTRGRKFPESLVNHVLTDRYRVDMDKREIIGVLKSIGKWDEYRHALEQLFPKPDRVNNVRKRKLMSVSDEAYSVHIESRQALAEAKITSNAQHAKQLPLLPDQTEALRLPKLSKRSGNS